MQCDPPPELLDKIALLGHELIIPSYVMTNELLDKNTIETSNKYLRQNKIRVLQKNIAVEIQQLKKHFPV